MAQMESPDRTERLTVRVPGDLLDEFDGMCEDRGTNRSAVVREMMQQAVSDAGLTDRQMPDNDRLATAYRALLRLTSGGGWIKREQATRYLAQQLPDVAENIAYGTLIKPLREKGYLRQTVTSDGRDVSLYVQS